MIEEVVCAIMCSLFPVSNSLRMFRRHKDKLSIYGHIINVKENFPDFSFLAFFIFASLTHPDHQHVEWNEMCDKKLTISSV